MVHHGRAARAVGRAERSARRIHVTIACTALADEKFGGRERLVDEGPPRSTHRGAIHDLCVRELLEDLKAQHELLPKRASNDRWREVEVADENLAVQATRGERAEERAPERF